MTVTIRTQVLSEIDIPIPETAALDGAQPVFEMLGGALYSQAVRIDAAGQTHHVFTTGLVVNNNITWAEYRTVPPHPGPYPAQATARIEASQKIDTVTMDRSGADLHLYFTTHETAPGNRRLRVELAIIPGVWRTSPGFEAQEGGAGAYSGGGPIPNPDPEPGGGGMTEEELRAVLGIPANQTLTAAIRAAFGAGGDVRLAIEQKKIDGDRDERNPNLPQGPDGLAARGAEFRALDKVWEAEKLAWILDPNNNHPAAGAVRYLLRYRTVEDGAYTAGMNAIRDSGLARAIAGPVRSARGANVVSALEIGGMTEEEKAGHEKWLDELRKRIEAEDETARAAAEERAAEEEANEDNNNDEGGE